MSIKVFIVDDHALVRTGFRLILGKEVDIEVVGEAESGEEALDIMEDISPVLADLADIWDSSLLRVSTLSLLGLYLAQGFVKEIIGEEFDLSRWFE